MSQRGRPPKAKSMTDEKSFQPPSFHETAEFKAAVQKAAAEAAQKAVAEATATLMAQMKQASGPAETDPNADHAFANSLAMAIAQLTDQGVGRKRVAPEILKARADARDRMIQLILDARANGQVPSYTLRNKVYLDEQLVDPVWVNPVTKAAEPREIDWPGIPNEAMWPANDVAKAIFDEFKASIGTIEGVSGLTNPLPGAEKLGVTARGLVVKGAAVRNNRALPSYEQNGLVPTAPSFGEGLRVRDRGVPGQYVETQILGTVQAPVRQTA